MLNQNLYLTGTVYAWCIDELKVESKLWLYHRLPTEASPDAEHFIGTHVDKQATFRPWKVSHYEHYSAFHYYPVFKGDCFNLACPCTESFHDVPYGPIVLPEPIACNEIPREWPINNGARLAIEAHSLPSLLGSKPSESFITPALFALR